MAFSTPCAHRLKVFQYCLQFVPLSLRDLMTVTFSLHVVYSFEVSFRFSHCSFRLSSSRCFTLCIAVCRGQSGFYFWLLHPLANPSLIFSCFASPKITGLRQCTWSSYKPFNVSPSFLNLLVETSYPHISQRYKVCIKHSP